MAVVNRSTAAGDAPMIIATREGIYEGQKHEREWERTASGLRSRMEARRVKIGGRKEKSMRKDQKRRWATVALRDLRVGGRGHCVRARCWGRFFWLVRLRRDDRWDLRPEDWHRGAGCGRTRALVRHQKRCWERSRRVERCGAAAIKGVGAFAGGGGAGDGDDAAGIAGVAVGAGGVGAEDAGGVDDAGGVVGIAGAGVVRDAAPVVGGSIGVAGTGGVVEIAVAAVVVECVGIAVVADVAVGSIGSSLANVEWGL